MVANNSNSSSEMKELKPGEAEAMATRLEFTPEADIYESEEAIHIALNVPGADPKAIELSIDSEILSVSAAKADDDVPASHKPAASASEAGIYKRSFSIQTDIDRTAITAKASDGVLRLTLPKAQKPKPQRIAVAVA